MKYYSASTGGFYPEEMRSSYEAAGSWPDDAREITEDEEAILRQPEPVPYSSQRDEYLVTVRTTREAILNRLAGMGLAALVEGDEAAAGAVAGARLALLDITKLPGVLAATTMAELESAMKAAYRAIVAAAPADMRSAFNLVDA